MRHRVKQRTRSRKKKQSTTSLSELAILFLKLGTIAFGGPAAHIAMMEDEVVRRRRWMTREDFLDLLGATNLIPGPNSTEMAIHIGHRRAGWKGLVVAGASFILPAMLIVTGFAWAYVRYGSVPQVKSVLYGVKPVIIVIVLQALWSLGRAALKTKLLAGIGIAGVVLTFLGLHELLVLLGGGLIVVAVRLIRRANNGQQSLWSLMSASPLIVFLQSGATTASFSMTMLFLFFLKVGAVLYGSGYVLLAFIRADLVDRWHWLTESQLLDAVAVGQVTPGPVFTTATFIGYVLGGTKGAVVATVGIFLPAFVFVAVSGPLVPRIRRSAPAGAFLDGVNAAALALMVVVTYQLGRAAIVDWTTIALAVLSGAILFGFRVNSAWLVLGGAIAGWLLYGR
ncbi:MAG TPA: chromate efflux transporter [Pyrinomonadaceae bacterium]|nr:chromate efflux transporter [Pyrinomonadaceae bacterium]